MGALTSSEIETIRWHAAKGVKPGTIAQWYGLKALEVRAILETAPSGAPAADEDQPRSAGTATAEPEETGHRPQGSDEAPPLREVDGTQPSANHSGQSDRPILFFEAVKRVIHRQPAALFAGVQPEPVDRRTLRRKMIRSGFAAAPAKTCQWIEGNPTPDDSCKCLAPSAPGVSYCPDHAARAYRVLPRGVAAAFPFISPTP
ncbi:GcrA cell cycle regulator [Azospirillum oryzae]|uniref:GcrA cell cycle regulator n=1 Tax=Azospirillum oryzae TaxID=286727 RepID=A0A1X7F969_9PROT|nr:GcrA family cell cycle regulator [Azospirillum oryzae]SMF47650.1 GcrA cell cycle regulator [Azospirillum oryzae]